MATYSISGSKYHSPGSGEWKRKEWGWYHGDGAGLVRIRIIDRRHHWITGYDPKYKPIGSINGRGIERTASIYDAKELDRTESRSWTE